MTVHPGHRTIIGILLLVAGLVWISAATLWPFTFQFHGITWNQYFTKFGSLPSDVLDFQRNVLLFVPYGLSLGIILEQSGRWSRRAALLIIMLLGFCTTAAIESLQIFLPNRTPTVSDILANTMGSVIGCGCFFLWCRRHTVAALVRARLTPARLLVVAGSYAVLVVAFSVALMRGFSPGGWAGSFRLALGNEISANTPWSGTVRDLLLLDRSVDSKGAARLLSGDTSLDLRKAVVAAYPLNTESGLHERGERLPPLVPSADRSPLQFPLHGVVLGKESWLATQNSVDSIAARVNASRQFTVAFTAGSMDARQAGPARIVTISRDPFQRNLTIGQEHASLILRWRSLLTGKNGTTPELRFPEVFRSANPQRIVITCDGTRTRLYTSGFADQEICLGPEAAFAAMLMEGRTWSLSAGSFGYWFPILLFHILLFVPFGVLLGLAVQGLPRWANRITVVGLITPALLLESLVASYGTAGIRFEVLALVIAVASGGFAAITMLSIRAKARRQSRSSTSTRVPRNPLSRPALGSSARLSVS